MELAIKHGNSLADQVVNLVKSKDAKPIKNEIQSYFSTIPLKFKKVPVADYQKDLMSPNKFIQRRAKLMLEAYNKGWNTETYTYRSKEFG